jgi:hypothetical protein
MRLKLYLWALFGLALVLSVPVTSAGPRQAAGQEPQRQPQPSPATKTPHRRAVLPIERSPHFGVILVSVQVNEKPAVLILDTGSNTTILSPEISGLNPARLPRANPPRKGTGFVGDGRWGQAALTIGTTVWKDKRVLVVDTKDLSAAFQRKIDGILGQDILDEFKTVEINLEEKRLTLGSD